MESLPAAAPPSALMQNCLGVLTQSGLNVHQEVVKTAEVYQKKIESDDKLIAEQAAKIAALEARVVQLTAEKKQELAAQASQHAADRSKLVASINAQQSHITSLGNRVDRHVQAVNELRAIFCVTHNFSGSFAMGVMELWGRAQDILNRAHNIV